MIVRPSAPIRERIVQFRLCSHSERITLLKGIAEQSARYHCPQELSPLRLLMGLLGTCRLHPLGRRAANHMAGVTTGGRFRSTCRRAKDAGARHGRPCGHGDGEHSGCPFPVQICASMGACDGARSSDVLSPDIHA